MSKRVRAEPGSRRDDEAATRRYKEHLDNRLDEALKETFPASDPIAVTPRRRASSRKR